MSVIAATILGTGLEITDLRDAPAFAARPERARDVAIIPEGMRRIAHAFIDYPDSVLQVLVETAVELCGADSSAISLEKEDRTEEAWYHWVAIAGEYSGMYNAIFPHYPTGCSVCLERGAPQHVRASSNYFDLLGITAKPVTDGLMFPWQTDAGRGTFYILAHEREAAFDQGDVRIMQILADFAAIGVRQIRQQKQLLRQAGLLAEAAMANTLAHNINNPLQSLINILYLAAEGHYGESAKLVGNQALGDLERLSSLVHELLSLPRRKAAVATS